MLAGRNPYTAVGPGLAFDWPWPLYYPVTALMLASPFAMLPLVWARLVFVFASGALLAYAVTRDGWYRLPMFAGGAYFMSVKLAQWSPLMTAAILLPELSWFAAAKPNVGVAVIVASPSLQQAVRTLLSCVMFVGASLLVQPGWIGDWRHAVASAQHFHPLLLHTGGFVLLLALARIRRPEARLLLALACVPQNTMVYEALPLALVAKTLRQSIALAFLSIFAAAIQLALVDIAGDYYTHTRWTALAMLALCYLPCLLLVLRRPADAPAAPFV
jgi:hypothetical protein